MEITSEHPHPFFSISCSRAPLQFCAVTHTQDEKSEDGVGAVTALFPLGATAKGSGLSELQLPLSGQPLLRW